MSAELLREAATLMRARAEMATFTAEPWDVDEIGDVWAQEADGQPILVCARVEDTDAVHIASWHPAVALAVADWLHGVADRCDQTSPARLDHDPEDQAWYLPAMAVARAYLGRDA